MVQSFEYGRKLGDRRARQNWDDQPAMNLLGANHDDDEDRTVENEDAIREKKDILMDLAKMKEIAAESGKTIDDVREELRRELSILIFGFRKKPEEGKASLYPLNQATNDGDIVRNPLYPIYTNE